MMKSVINLHKVILKSTQRRKEKEGGREEGRWKLINLAPQARLILKDALKDTAFPFALVINCKNRHIQRYTLLCRAKRKVHCKA